MQPEYVLYVSPICANSIELVNLIQRVPQEKILIQDVKLLKVFPVWLKGTPLLVDTNSGLMYKGTDAINYVKILLTSIQHQQVIQQQPRTPPDNTLMKTEKKNSLMDDLFQMDQEIDDPKYQEKARGISEQSLAKLQNERSPSDRQKMAI